MEKAEAIQSRIAKLPDADDPKYDKEFNAAGTEYEEIYPKANRLKLLRLAAGAQDKVEVADEGGKRNLSIAIPGGYGGTMTLTREDSAARNVASLTGKPLDPSAKIWRTNSIEVPESARGKGYGQMLYLAAHADGGWLYNSQAEPGAVRALEALKEKGLIELYSKGGTAGVHASRLTDAGRKLLADAEGPEADSLVPEPRKGVLARARKWLGFAESPEAEDFSPAGADGQRAITLLQNVRTDARAAFVESCRTAIERLIATGEPFQQGTLFSDEELAVVADSLSRSIAVGDLLGRVRIRRRAERAQKMQTFADAESRNQSDFPEEVVKEVADQWFPADGTRVRSPIQMIISKVMEDRGLPLRDAAKLVEQSLLYYGGEHVNGGKEQYWDLVSRIEKQKTWFPKSESFAEWRGPFEGERGGRYWLADGAQDTPENRRYENPNEGGGDGGAQPQPSGEQKAEKVNRRMQAVVEAAEKIPFTKDRIFLDGRGPVDVWGLDEDGADPTYQFVTSAGKRYGMVVATSEEPVRNKEIIFSDENDEIGITGAGNATEVITKVSVATVAYLKKKQPKIATFSAAGNVEGDGAGESSRASLYEKLTKMISMIDKSYASFSYIDDDNKTIFVLVKRPEFEKVKAAVPARARGLKVLSFTEQEAYEMFAELDFESFADDDDPYHDFAEPVPNLEPTRAVDYFRKLVPSLGGSSARYGPRLDRHSFTLAVASDQVILDRVKAAILRSLQSGSTDAGIVVEDILDEAGVSPRNPQYADMVVRTNIMDAYNQGAQDELAEPDMQEAFPVWEYLGVQDSRTGEDHAPKIGKYYPSSVPFAEVRGGRVFNCRCSFAPVSRFMSGNLKVEEEW